MKNSKQLIELPVTREQIKAERCRRSFYYFFRYFWDQIAEEDLIDNWHIKYLCDELQEVALRLKERKPRKYDLIINIPPGSTKSTIATIMFPVWCWTIDPSLRFITGSYSLDLSTEHAVKSRDIIRSDKFKALFPDIDMKEDVDNKRNYENDHKGARIVTSVTGTSTGRHAHCILIDDPVNPTQAASEIQRKSANDWIDKTLSTRKIDKTVTVTILIMQRLHEDDPTGHLLSKKNKKIKHICLPAEITEDIQPPELVDKYENGLFDPIRMSRLILEESRLDLGSTGYAGQMLQSPAPDEGNYIKIEWFQYFNVGDVPSSVARNFYSDTAYGKEQSDRSATMAWSIHDGFIYIWSVWDVNLTFPEFIESYIDFLRENNYTDNSRCYFEPKASGISIIQQLRTKKLNERRLNIIEDEPPKDGKLTRLQAILPTIEAGRVKLLRGQSWHDDFLKQCKQFPNSEFDDQVDCLSAVVRIASKRLSGGDVSRGGSWSERMKRGEPDRVRDREQYFKSKRREMQRQARGFI